MCSSDLALGGRHTPTQVGKCTEQSRMAENAKVGVYKSVHLTKLDKKGCTSPTEVEKYYLMDGLAVFHTRYAKHKLPSPVSY